jgi:hypothetical protein
VLAQINKAAPKKRRFQKTIQNKEKRVGMGAKVKCLLFAVAVALLAAAIFHPSLRKPPSERAHAMVPSPPPSADPIISRAQIEQHELSLDKIAGLSGEQAVGLLNRMNPTERAELGRRLTLLAPSAMNNDKIALFFRAWAKFDARAAFQMALNFKNTSQTWVALASVFEGAEAKEASSLVDSLKNLAPGTISAEVAQGLLHTGLSKWAAVDAAGAARFLDNYGDDIPPSAWQAVAESWGMVDPAGALAWVNEQPNAAIKEKQMDGLMTGWMKTDLPAAAEYARGHLDGTLKSESHVALAANYFAANDPKAAIAYIQTLPEGSAKQFAQSMAATKWAYNDPAAAAAWVSSLPAEDQAAAAGGVVAMWATQDPQAAGNWLNTLQGSARDSAISAYSANLAPRDPGSALGWAQSIEDASIRTSTVDALVSQWLQRDRTRATDWINSSQLPDADKMHLLSPSPPLQ